MKRMIAVSLTLLLVAIATPAFAQQATTSTEPALKPEEVRQIRDAATAIAEILKGDQKAATAKDGKASEKKEEESNKKNIADVADRALSILSGYIGSAASAMQKVAPEVWRVMIRQQYANAVAGPLIPLALIGFVAIFVVVVKHWWTMPTLQEDPDSDERSDYNANWWGRFWITNIVPFVLSFSFGIWASIAIADSIQMLINPEYYAFRDLLQLILRRGGL